MHSYINMNISVQSFKYKMTKYIPQSMDDALNVCLGVGNYTTVCINLERATERRRRFSKWAEEIGMTFRYWKAKDYQCLTSSDLAHQCDVHINRKQAKGASACRISITDCLLSMMEDEHAEKDYIVIFEDDAGFVRNGTSTPSSDTVYSNKQCLLDFLMRCGDIDRNKWDQIWLGYYDDDIANTSEYSPGVFRCRGTSCTHAMILHRRVVQKLLSKLMDPRTSRLPIDAFTKGMMKDHITLSPPMTIVCHTDIHGFIDYP